MTETKVTTSKIFGTCAVFTLDDEVGFLRVAQEKTLT